MDDGEPTGYEIGVLLRLAHRRAADTFAAALRPMEIQGRHFGVLITLRREGQVRQRELIERLASDKSSMVRTIDDLEERGLCQRTAVAADRRANAVRLTAAGREVLRVAEDTANKVSGQLLACLRPEERDLLRELLGRFVAGDGRDPHHTA
ncbi:MAG: MarR family winged helix-turn-helix transcriptional regulator [Sciscionella sp.]